MSCLLSITYGDPGFFLWEVTSSPAAFTKPAPPLISPGALGRDPPVHPANS